MQSAQFLRHAFLRHAPSRYAVMLDLATARRRRQKYHKRTGRITGDVIRQHLAGRITLAATARDGQVACLPPLDLDAGGLPDLPALRVRTLRRGLWDLGQFCPHADYDDPSQRGYVWVPFAGGASVAQLHVLGAHLARSAQMVARAHATVTRRLVSRHPRSDRFGALLLEGQAIPIDPDPRHARAWRQAAYRANPVAALPPLPAAPTSPVRALAPLARSADGITIERHNQDHDLVALLAAYDAQPARDSRRLRPCPGHPDTRRASLLPWRALSSKLLCRCLRQHDAHPLASQLRDACGVLCAPEDLTPAQALRRLTSRKEGARC